MWFFVIFILFCLVIRLNFSHNPFVTLPWAYLSLSRSFQVSFCLPWVCQWVLSISFRDLWDQRLEFPSFSVEGCKVTVRLLFQFDKSVPLDLQSKNEEHLCPLHVLLLGALFQLKVSLSLHSWSKWFLLGRLTQC